MANNFIFTSPGITFRERDINIRYSELAPTFEQTLFDMLRNQKTENRLTHISEINEYLGITLEESIDALVEQYEREEKEMAELMYSIQPLNDQLTFN